MRHVMVMITIMSVMTFIEFNYVKANNNNKPPPPFSFSTKEYNKRTLQLRQEQRLAVGGRLCQNHKVSTFAIKSRAYSDWVCAVSKKLHNSCGNGKLLLCTKIFRMYEPRGPTSYTTIFSNLIKPP